jgi:hypothetical protein
MKKLFLTLVLAAFAVISFAQNVPSYVPTNGLVGWWPFNGNANDESGNGNNGTVNGATLTTDRFGNVGKAYSFDGVNDYILTTRTSQSSFSISLWFLTNQNNLFTPFIDAYNSNFELYLKNLKPNFTKWITAPGNYQEYTSNTSANLNQWNHLVCTYSNGNIKLFLNNVLISSFQNVAITNNNNGSFYFGASISGTFQYYNGKLDDIGFWNRALTQQEITDLYNGNICYQNITVTDTLLINTGITGFNPITYENTLRVWPNPTNDHITIDAGNLNVMNGYSIRITNSLGQQMFQSAINQQQFYLDLSTWTGNGMYFLNLIDPSGNIIDIKKIVLQ